jgi:hypothetical protein
MAGPVQLAGDFDDRCLGLADVRFALGHQTGDPDVGLVWAGEGTDLISVVEPAGELVGQIIAEAEGLLRGASRQLDH